MPDAKLNLLGTQLTKGTTDSRYDRGTVLGDVADLDNDPEAFADAIAAAAAEADSTFPGLSRLTLQRIRAWTDRETGTTNAKVALDYLPVAWLPFLAESPDYHLRLGDVTLTRWKGDVAEDADMASADWLVGNGDAVTLPFPVWTLTWRKKISVPPVATFTGLCNKVNESTFAGGGKWTCRFLGCSADPIDDTDSIAEFAVAYCPFGWYEDRMPWNYNIGKPDRSKLTRFWPDGSSYTGTIGDSHDADFSVLPSPG